MSNTPTPSEALLLANRALSAERDIADGFESQINTATLFRHIVGKLARYVIAREAVVEELVAFLDKVIASDQEDKPQPPEAVRENFPADYFLNWNDGPLAKDAREFKRRLEG